MVTTRRFPPPHAGWRASDRRYRKRWSSPSLRYRSPEGPMLATTGYASPGTQHRFDCCAASSADNVGMIWDECSHLQKFNRKAGAHESIRALIAKSPHRIVEGRHSPSEVECADILSLLNVIRFAYGWTGYPALRRAKSFISP